MTRPEAGHGVTQPVTDRSSQDDSPTGPTVSPRCRALGLSRFTPSHPDPNFQKQKSRGHSCRVTHLGTGLTLCGHLGGQMRGHQPGPRARPVQVGPGGWRTGRAIWPALSGEARALDTRLLPAGVVSNPALIQKPGREDRVASLPPEAHVVNQDMKLPLVAVRTQILTQYFAGHMFPL